MRAFRLVASLTMWVFFLLSVCLSLPDTAFPQAGGDTPLVGYAIVTVVLGDVNNLQVVETMGLSTNCGGAQASMSPPTLTNKSAMLVSIDPTVQRDAGLAIANPGNSNANVGLTLVDSSGRTVASQTINLPAGRQVARFVSEIFPGAPALAQSFDGTLILSADNAVGVIALRFRGTSFGNLPVSNLIPSPNPLPLLGGGSIGGVSSVLLPQFATGGDWASQFTATNNAAFPMIIRVDVFDQNGNPLTVQLNNQTGSSFTNMQIPAGGIVTLGTPSSSSNIPSY